MLKSRTVACRLWVMGLTVIFVAAACMPPLPNAVPSMPSEGSRIDIVFKAAESQGECVPGRTGLKRSTTSTPHAFRVRVRVDSPLCSPIRARAAIYAMPSRTTAWPQRLVESKPFELSRPGTLEITFSKLCQPEQFDLITGAVPATVAPWGPWHGPLLFPFDLSTSQQHVGCPSSPSTTVPQPSTTAPPTSTTSSTTTSTTSTTSTTTTTTTSTTSTTTPQPCRPRVVETVQLPPTVSSRDLVFDGEQLWMTSPEGLVSFDPVTKTVGPVVDVGYSSNVDWVSAASDLHFDGESIWATTGLGSSLVRVDPQSRSLVASLPLAANLRGIASSGSRVWVVRRAWPSTLYTIDRSTNSVVDSAESGVFSANLVVADDSLWLSNNGDETGGRAVRRIDPSTGSVLAEITAGVGRPDNIYFDGERIWVQSSASGYAPIDTTTNVLGTRLILTGPDALPGAPATTFIPTLPGARLLAIQGDSLWFIDPQTDELLELDATSRTFAPPNRIGTSGALSREAAFDGRHLWIGWGTPIDGLRSQFHLSKIEPC